MNKEEFLKKLEALLSDMDEAERKEALQYYKEYFEDSEKEEADVIKELGSPEEVAHNIREELAEKEIVPTRSNSKTNQSQTATPTKENKGMEPWAVVLIVLLVLFFGIPVGIPLLAGGFGIIVGVIAVVFALILAAVICAVAFGVAAIMCFVASIIKLFAVPLAGVILLGVSLVLLGLCFLFTLITWKACVVVIPAMVNGIVYLCRLPFHNRKGAEV